MESEFKGMTNSESALHQLSEWVKGRSIHNPIRDECTPDFSCCGSEIMDEDLRIKFSNAHKMGDEKITMRILGMSLSGITSSENLNIHIAGEDNIVN